MISLIIEQVISKIVSEFKEIGIILHPFYSYDTELDVEYLKNKNVSSMFDIDKDGNVIKLQKDYVLLLYNKTPVKPVDYAFNNINLQLATYKLDSHEITTNKKFNITKETSSNPYKVVMTKSTADDVVIEDYDYTIRNFYFGTFTINFTFYSSDAELIDDIECIYNQKLNKDLCSVKFNLELNDNIIIPELEYSGIYSTVNTNSPSQYYNKGTLYKLSATAEITGPIFSVYSSNTKVFKDIILTIIS